MRTALSLKSPLHCAAAMFLAVGWGLLSGCSGSDDRLAVSGTVTLDGRPLSDSLINFRPAAGVAANSSGGMVKDGEFQVPAAKGLKPGTYRVTIHAWLKTGKTFEDPQLGTLPETVPVKYKEAGTLEATVTASGANHFDFQLTTANKAVR